MNEFDIGYVVGLYEGEGIVDRNGTIHKGKNGHIVAHY